MLCPICLELMIFPALTACGHAFCYQCIDESVLFSQNCPNCRENIKGSPLVLTATLDEIIRGTAMVSRDHRSVYEERFKKFQEWRSQREIKC